MDTFWQIFYNIIGGVLVAILILAWSGLHKKYYRHSFKKILGETQEIALT